MTEPKDKATPQNEPPEVVAHDIEGEEHPCNGHVQCGVHQTEEQ